MKRCLLLIVVLSMVLPSLALSDTPTSGEALHTLWDIPWDTKSEDVISVFKEKAGIVLKEGPYVSNTYSSSEDQSITIAGKEVSSLGAMALGSTLPIVEISIDFRPGEDYSSFNKDSSQEERIACYQKALVTFCELADSLTEKYGESQVFLKSSDTLSVTNAQLFFVNIPLSDAFWDSFLSLAAKQTTTWLCFNWNNINLIIIIDNYFYHITPICLVFKDEPFDYLSKAINLYGAPPASVLTPPPSVSLGF